MFHPEARGTWTWSWRGKSLPPEMGSWWLPVGRARALGQLEGPGLANKNIPTRWSRPKHSKWVNTENGPRQTPRAFGAPSQCPPTPLPTLLCPKWTGVASMWASGQSGLSAWLSFLSLSFLPSSTPHTSEVGPLPSLRVGPGPAKLCHPRPNHTSAENTVFSVSAG